MWDFLTATSKHFWDFWKSRNGTFAIILLALWIGLVSLEQIKEVVDIVKGLFE